MRYLRFITWNNVNISFIDRSSCSNAVKRVVKYQFYMILKK